MIDPYCEEDVYVRCQEKNSSFMDLVNRLGLELDFSRQPTYNPKVREMLKDRGEFEHKKK